MSMLMRQWWVAITLACLTYTGQGRRVQTSLQRLANSESATSQNAPTATDAPKPTEEGTSAMPARNLLTGIAEAPFASNAAAAFNPSSPGSPSVIDGSRSTNLDRGRLVSHRAPVMGASDTLTVNPDKGTHSENSPAYEISMRTPAKNRARIDRMHTPYGVIDTFGVAPLGAAPEPTLSTDLSKTSLNEGTDYKKEEDISPSLEHNRLRLEEIFKMEHAKDDPRSSQLQPVTVEVPPKQQRHSADTDGKNVSRKVSTGSDHELSEPDVAWDTSLLLRLFLLALAAAIILAILAFRKKATNRPSATNADGSGESADIQGEMLEHGLSDYDGAGLTHVVKSTVPRELSAQEDVDDSISVEDYDTTIETEVAPASDMKVNILFYEVEDMHLGKTNPQEDLQEAAAKREEAATRKSPAEAQRKSEKESKQSASAILEHTQASKQSATVILEHKQADADQKKFFDAAFAEAEQAAQLKAAVDAKRSLLRLIRMRNAPRKQRRLRRLQMLRRMKLRMQRVLRMRKQRMLRMRREQPITPETQTGSGGKGPPSDNKVIRTWKQRARQSQRRIDALLTYQRIEEKIRQALKRTKC